MSKLNQKQLSQLWWADMHPFKKVEIAHRHFPQLHYYKIAEKEILHLYKMETRPEVSFNINEIVKVKLTESGKKTWENNYNQFLLADSLIFEEYFKMKTDEDGYTEFQLHSLLHIFGPATYMGNENSFVNNEILFNQNNFKTIVNK